MKKLLLMIILLASFLAFVGQAFAAPISVYSKYAYVEHRAWEAGTEITYLIAGMQVKGFEGTVLDQQTATFLGSSHYLPEFSHSLMPSDLREFSGGYSINTTNLSMWETDYTFHLSGEGKSIDDSVSINDGDFEVLNFALPTITGNIVSWNNVNGADLYKIRLLDDTGDRVFDSGILYETTIDLSNTIATGNYNIRIEAWKTGTSNSLLTARSVYFSEITLSPVPEPSTISLLAIGLLGLAGVSRKKQ